MRQIRPNLIGAIDIIVRGIPNFLESVKVTVPATAEAELRHEHAYPAAYIDTLQEGIGSFFLAPAGNLVNVYDHVVDGMVGRDCAKARIAKGPKEDLLGRLVKIWGTGDRIADNHTPI